MPIDFSIADVERDTGIGKDTLRVWERRYGFPRPRRDALGERVYPAAQVEKLRVIKRLMDAGHRPGNVVSLPLAQLRKLGARAEGAVPKGAPQSTEVENLLELAGQHDAPALMKALAVAQARHGLRRFVVDVVAPLTHRMGDAWAHGELRIFEEHLVTECLTTVIHAALADLGPRAKGPRVMLATLPGEPHGLGLLMAQSVLALEGCRCLSLGVQVPLDEIAMAAAEWRADVVALSVTGCMKSNLVLESLAQLRARLRADAALWVGGAAPALGRATPAGMLRVASLEGVASAVAAWRAARER
jgi:methanogenic corrinoid protein MtbC1